MIRHERMTEAHARAFRPQPHQADMELEQRVQTLLSMAAEDDAWSYFSGDKLLGIGGIGQAWENRAVCWILLSSDAGPHLLALTRYLRAFIDAYGFGRVEMYVDANFRPGWRWAGLLGFECETPGRPMRRFFPNGNDAYLYARVI